MKRKLMIVFLSAAAGYLVIYAICFEYFHRNVRPSTWLEWLAPAGLLWATEAPPESFILRVVGPLNAMIYGSVAFALTSIAQRLRENYGSRRYNRSDSEESE